ncbi:MAG: hypothetical protein ACLP9Y_21910 [Mycobacterium sp.]|jgi:uncharacterized membrane protein YecN with MAPEG domain
MSTSGAAGNVVRNAPISAMQAAFWRLAQGDHLGIRRIGVQLFRARVLLAIGGQAGQLVSEL